MKKVNAPLPWPRNIGTNNIDLVKEILQKTLAKRPQDRYKHIGDLYSDLQSLVGEQTGFQPNVSIKTTYEEGVE